MLPLASIVTSGDPTISFPPLWRGAAVLAALGCVGWVLADLEARGVRPLRPLLLVGWTFAWMVILADGVDRVTRVAYDNYPGFGLNGLDYLPGTFLLLGSSLICLGSAGALVVRERRRVRNTDPAPSIPGVAGHARTPWPTKEEAKTAFRRHRRFVAIAVVIGLVGIVVNVALDRIGKDPYTADFDPPPDRLAWPQHARDDLYSSCMEVTEDWSEARSHPTSCACFLTWFERAFVSDSGTSLASDIRSLGYFPQDANVNALLEHCFPSAEAAIEAEATAELESARDLDASVGDATSTEIAAWLNENWFGDPQTGMPYGAEVTSNGVLCLDASPRMGGDTMVKCYLPPSVDAIEPICTAASELATAFGDGDLDSWGTASDRLHETVVEADIAAEFRSFLLAGEFTSDGASEFLVQSASNGILFEAEADSLQSWAHKGLHVNGEHVLGQLYTHFVAACGVEIVLPAALELPLDG
jgi:hypothetical protein